jgi:hypothetical protein
MLAIAIAFPACGPSPQPSSATASAPSAQAAIRVDQALVGRLPDDVEGIPLEFDAEASSDAAATDTDLAAYADAIAFAVAADEESADIVVATILDLTGPTLGAGEFRDLRETYDSGICGADGLAGNAEAELGGRIVHIGTCANGGHTYHALLERSGVVVSAFSQGERRFGEALMRGLRDS